MGSTPFLKKWKTLIDLSLAVLMFFATCLLVRITFNSDATFEKEEQILASERLHLAREEFTKSLDEADRFCSKCQTCAPPFGILAPLDRAAIRANDLGEVLTAAEYNRLAILGSSAWEFDRTYGFASKALDKSKKTNSQLDKFMSYLVLGHLKFVKFKETNDPAVLRDARDRFQDCVKELDSHSSTDSYRYYLGKAHALWALHEKAVPNMEESGRHVALANAHWKGLNGFEIYAQQLKDDLTTAAPGELPNIACLFHVDSPLGCSASSAMPTGSMSANSSLPMGSAAVTSPTTTFVEEKPMADRIPTPPLGPFSADPDSYIAGINLAINRHPFPESYFTRGMFHEQKAKQEYRLAVYDYTEAIRLKPRFIEAFEARASARLNADDPGGYSEDMEAAKKLRQPTPVPAAPKAPIPEPAPPSSIAPQKTSDSPPLGPPMLIEVTASR